MKAEETEEEEAQEEAEEEEEAEIIDLTQPAGSGAACTGGKRGREPELTATQARRVRKRRAVEAGRKVAGSSIEMLTFTQQRRRRQVLNQARQLWQLVHEGEQVPQTLQKQPAVPCPPGAKPAAAWRPPWLPYPGTTTTMTMTGAPSLHMHIHMPTTGSPLPPPPPPPGRPWLPPPPPGRPIARFPPTPPGIQPSESEWDGVAINISYSF